MMATMTPPTTAMTMEVWTAFWTPSRSSLPMALAMTTVVPKAMPMNKPNIRLMMGPLAPTAATAAVRLPLAKLPTTATSDALNSCPNTAVAATGRANRRILSQMEPWSMSSLAVPCSISSTFLII